jgi:hypothetical protein
MLLRVEECAKQVILVAIVCVACICQQAVYAMSQTAASSARTVLTSFSERALPREPSAVRARDTVLIATPILVFGLLGLAIITAVISIRMICGSPANNASSARPARKVHAGEHRVASHYT